MATQYDLLWRDPGNMATLYDNDAVSNPRPQTVVISNAKYVPMLGTARGDAFVGRVPAGQSLVAGQVLFSVSLLAGWYVVVKPLQASHFTLWARPASFSLLALPLLVTLKDKVTTKPAPQFLNARDEPRYRTQGGGVAGIPTTTTTFRAGMSNAFNALSLQLEGELPNSLTTYYCPLGQSLALDDEVLLPDGSPARVTRLYYKDADGVPYAREFVATGSVGTAL